MMTQATGPSTLPAGSLTVITGSMFSGKTEELIRRLRRALYARRSVQVFKHALDTRAELTEIRTHNGVLHEAQFFDEGIVETCRRLANSGHEVIAAGLDMDFRGRPFGPMPALLAEA